MKIPNRREMEMSTRYREHLKSRAWWLTRQRKLREAGERCERCGAGKLSGLQIHHKTYERLGREQLSDLEVLCGLCHEVHHGSSQTLVDGIMKRAKPRPNKSIE